jgi:hypothetical protein
MARIRSIKPDFFQSEKIATLPLSTRLLFIGMWTHADDNGCMVDNAKLINAAVWPLEDDPLETLRRTQEDLRRLSSAHLIARYVTGNRRLIFITGWDEHQKVSHPGKQRYPRPTVEQLEAATCENDESPEGLGSPSGDSPEDLVKPPEILVPEQGAGSREQGREKTSSPASRPRDTEPETDDLVTANEDSDAIPGLPPVASLPKKPEPGSDDDPDWLKFWSIFPNKSGKADARKAWAKAVKKFPVADLLAGAERFRAQMVREKREKSYIKQASGWLNGERWTDEIPGRSGPNGAASNRPAISPRDEWKFRP